VHNAHITHGIGSQSSSVGIETRLQGGRLGVRILVVDKTSVLFKTSRPALGPAQPVIELVPELFSDVKRPGREVSHSSPSSAVVKNEWSCTYTSSNAFATWTGKSATFTHGIGVCPKAVISAGF
jgi:hypothetical protein